jgi:hypothetical protein
MKRHAPVRILTLVVSVSALAGCAALEEGVRYSSDPTLCYLAESGPKEPHYEAAKAELAKRRFKCSLAAIEEGRQEVAAIRASNDPNMERTMRRDAGPPLTCQLVGNTRICR